MKPLRHHKVQENGVHGARDVCSFILFPAMYLNRDSLGIRVILDVTQRKDETFVLSASLYLGLRPTAVTLSRLGHFAN
jgi:hypothetical protein